MLDTTVMFYIAAEIAVFLLLIGIFLLFHIKKLRALIAKLEAKIRSLRKELKKSRKAAKQALDELAEKSKIKPKALIDYIDEEIDNTRDYHEGLNPDQDIVLDISPEAPVERQAASLRHAFLIAEKEAKYAGSDDESNWAVLQAKLQQIIDFYRGANPPEEKVEEIEEPVVQAQVDNTEEVKALKARIENLEGFKTLFFDMEGQWESAKVQAEEYYQKLMELGRGMGAGDDFTDLLHDYSKTFDDLGLVITGQEVDESRSAQAETAVQVSVVKGAAGGAAENQEEINRLRSMAVDQHKVIEELKKKLLGADSVEAKDEVIGQLTKELEQLQRFVKEAETCTELIEGELNRAIEENEDLRKKLGTLGDADVPKEEVERLETMVNDFTDESRGMLATIASIEEENQELKQTIESGELGIETVEGGSADAGELKEKLADVQQELLNLQTQHIELEERYLELKMKG